MKKLLPLIAVLLLFGTAQAQGVAPERLYTMGSYVTDQSFTEHYGAYSWGAIKEFGKGWSARAGYREINIGGGDNIKAVDLCGMKNFHIGKDYKIYVIGGITDNEGDYYQGMDGFGGFGFSKTLLTWKGETRDGGIDIFAEAIGFDVEGKNSERKNYGQINIGITIAQPLK